MGLAQHVSSQLQPTKHLVNAPIRRFAAHDPSSRFAGPALIILYDEDVTSLSWEGMDLHRDGPAIDTVLQLTMRRSHFFTIHEHKRCDEDLFVDRAISVDTPDTPRSL